MAGHNKWSQIKRKKAANDKARGKTISKHVRAIISAVREGGGTDPASNLALKNALSAAKSDDVPNDNIERALEKALGAAEGGEYERAQYEGYGPAGVAVLVEALTDNRNRTAGEVRHVFSKHGGNMSGSTAWQFDAKGLVVLPDASEDLQLRVMDLGVEELEADDDALSVYTSPTDLYDLVDKLQGDGLEPEVARLTKIPQTLTPLDGDEAAKVVRFLEALEDLEDVQDVFSTADLENAAVDA